MKKNTNQILKKLKNKENTTTLKRTAENSKQKKDTPYRVLITTVLSQRNRDESTEIAAAKLFSKLPTIEQIANANLKTIEPLIRQSGFYRTKAKRIKEISRILLEKYNGKVPLDILELIKLPGVGRKTANCVLVYGYNMPAIPVDTHVHRISNRIGLVHTKTPEQTEQELQKLFAKKLWIEINELFVAHGKSTCKPISPLCSQCPVSKYCDFYFIRSKQKKKQ